MDIVWIEPEKLEEWALMILKKCHPEALTTPQEINILEITKFVCQKYEYDFAAYPLPKIGNSKVLGCVDIKNKRLLLDVDMLGQAASCNTWTFIAAHELGHLILHRQYFENGHTPYDYNEIEDGLPREKRLEWQANRFASELLLPREMVNLVVRVSSAQLHITRNFGNIILDGQKCNYDILNAISKNIAKTFAVSMTVAKIRLKELDIIIGDLPKEPYSKVGDIL